jgi:hypothetical protein
MRPDVLLDLGSFGSTIDGFLDPGIPGTLSVRSYQEEVGQLPRVGVSQRSGIPPEPADLLDELHRFRIHRDDPLRVKLPQGDMEGPLVIGHLLKAVEFEVAKLSHPNPRGARQEKTQRREAPHRPEFLPESLIALLGKRLGKVLVRRWEIGSPDETFLRRRLRPSPSR